MLPSSKITVLIRNVAIYSTCMMQTIWSALLCYAPQNEIANAPPNGPLLNIPPPRYQAMKFCCSRNKAVPLCFLFLSATNFVCLLITLHKSGNRNTNLYLLVPRHNLFSCVTKRKLNIIYIFIFRILRQTRALECRLRRFTVLKLFGTDIMYRHMTVLWSNSAVK
jgi:hypothetical protein